MRRLASTVEQLERFQNSRLLSSLLLQFDEMLPVDIVVLIE
jgi:hypothetical protein